MIALLLQVALFTSCNRRYDEAEVIEATKTLLKDAEKLNLVYYGSGIRYYDSENSESVYRKAEKSHLDELGFHTLGELYVLTEKTFSDEYSNILYSTILDTLRDGENIVGYKRYYQTYNESTGEYEIMVHSKFTPLMKDTVSYDYDSVRVNGAKKEKVYVTVSATVTNSDGAHQNIDIVITLIEEEDGWKIDNPTYANYNGMR